MLNVIPTGIPEIDHDLLISYDNRPLGGLPTGRITAVWGEPSSGMSTFSFHLLGSFLASLPPFSAAWIDGDFALRDGVVETICREYGIEEDVVFLYPPVEDRLPWATSVIGTLAPVAGLIIIDSLDGLVEGDSGELDKFIASTAQIALENDICVVTTSHEFFGVQKNATSYVGQNALKKYGSLGLRLSGPGTIEVAWAKICQTRKRVKWTLPIT